MGSLSKDVVGSDAVLKSFEKSFMLLMNAISLEDTTLLPNLEPKILKPALLQSIEDCLQLKL